MIKIRLSRQGKRNAPFYKIVAVESQKKSDGKYLDSLGFYNPTKKEFKIDNAKLEKWIKNGAQLSEVVKNLIEKK